MKKSFTVVAALVFTMIFVLGGAAFAFENAPHTMVPVEEAMPYQFRIYYAPRAENGERVGGHYRYVTVHLPSQDMSIGFEQMPLEAALSSTPIKAVGN